MENIHLGLPDIERDGFCFSDGCGFIDSICAQKIAQGCYNYQNVSAFQIRIGGAKGVLVAKENINPQ